MFKCARPHCKTNAKSSCSGCGREQYCCGECQKLDWKLHKSMCPILKKLLNTQQPYRTVTGIIDEILASKKGNDIRVLEHLLLYAEYQFGKQVPGTAFRERDGQEISHWDAEISCLYVISSRISGVNFSNDSTAALANKISYPYYKRQLCFLTPWFIHFPLKPNGIDRLANDQMYYLLHQLYFTESMMSMAAINHIITSPHNRSLPNLG
jgi:hypothetical protein